jgi:putative DNA primase/helicase
MDFSRKGLWEVPYRMQTHENKNLTTTLWYAEELGLHVFPCWPKSKNPATTNGFKNATDDIDTIKNWWEKVPEYNVAVWTSKESGIFVLDIDKKHGGFAALAALEKEYGKLPESWTVRTGGGGNQIYFKHPGEFVPNTIGGIAKGIDVRGDDGYVIAPPSIHPDTGKAYKWEKAPLEYPLNEAPEWLLDLNKKGKERKREGGKKGGQRKLVPYGERDREFAREAGKMRSWSYDKEQIAINLHYFYDNNCEHMAGDDPTEIKKRIDSLSERACENWSPNEKEYELTDMGNAERFGDLFAEVARYCTPWKKWVIWNKRHWAKDSALRVQELAKECVRRIKMGADKFNDNPEKQKHWMKWYWKSQSSERLGAMVKQARSILAVSPEDFDKDPWLLNVKNGTIDLKTGGLKKHDRKDLITKMAPVNYDKNAKYPTFKRFINDIMLGDPELTGFLQRFLGYSLTGDTRERVFVVFYGSAGKNGKSTLLERIKDVMGDYAISTRAETLLSKEKGALTNDIARLYGSRFVCANESEEGKKLDEPTIKELAGGEDTVTARFMYGEYFDFRPNFKICLRTNHLPKVSADSQAIWDRIRLVPFDMRVRSDDDPDGTVPEDKSLKEKLRGELDGILMWCLEGCLTWQREGLMAPKRVRNATREYREEEDRTAAFLEDLCILEGETKAGDILEAYKAWCVKNNYRPCGSQKLHARLKKKGLIYKKLKEGRFWLGVTLTDEAAEMIKCNDLSSKSLNYF